MIKTGFIPVAAAVGRPLAHLGFQKRRTTMSEAFASVGLVETNDRGFMSEPNVRVPRRA